MGEMKIKKILSFCIILLLLSSVAIPLVSSETITQTDVGEKSDTYDLLILAPPLFKRSLEPLVCHKNKFGVITKLVTLNHVYEGIWYGRDKAEKIKYFIKDAIEESGIKYVLLVGGIKRQFSFHESWWLPVRYAYIEDRWSGFDSPATFREPKFLCDLYFADIYDSEGEFSSWDDDGDGVYAEWNDNESAEDIPDLYPDVYVGRLPCRNILEVKIMVNKIISYESEDHKNAEWFKRMVVVAGDTYSGDDYEGETETQEALDMMPGFTPVKLWGSEGNLTGPIDVIRAFYNGCGFIYFAGHGSSSSWGTHVPEVDGIVYGLKNHLIPLLRNRNKLPVCIMASCHPNMFNVSIFHTSWNPQPILECISWHLTRKIGGGTIATIGSTGLSYGPKDKLDPGQGGGLGDVATYFFEEYGMNNNDTLGVAFGNAIGLYLDEFPIQWDQNSYNDTSLDAKNVAQLVLFGDPSLKIGGYNTIEN